MNDIRDFVLEGSPEERGYAHGQLLQDEIHQLYERHVKQMQEVERAQGRLFLHFPESTLLAHARAHAHSIQEYAPNIYAELQALASGAGMTFDQTLLLNCAAEVRRLAVTDAATQSLDPSLTVAPLAPPVAPHPGCTCLAAQGCATVDGSVYIGQGYDTDPFWTPVVFRIVPQTGEPEQIVMGHPGVLAEFGLNGAGLAFVASGLLVTDHRPGVPAPVVARKLLEQTRLSDALDAVIRAKRTIGVDYVLAAPYAAVNLQTSATEYDFSYLKDEVFACANHVRSPALKKYQVGLYGADTLVREGRMKQLLREQHGSLNLDALKAVQSDHADYPFGICRHTLDGVSFAHTRCAVLIKPEERLLLITDGNPCERSYQEFRARPYNAENLAHG